MHMFVFPCVSGMGAWVKVCLTMLYIHNSISVVPKLQYLNADGLANGSILLEWRLEYDGGHPVVEFEIHISSGAGRTRRDTTIPDLVYHVDVHSNQLVTSTVRQGQTYSIVAMARNILGASSPQTTNGE